MMHSFHAYNLANWIPFARYGRTLPSAGRYHPTNFRYSGGLRQLDCIQAYEDLVKQLTTLRSQDFVTLSFKDGKELKLSRCFLEPERTAMSSFEGEETAFVVVWDKERDFTHDIQYHVKGKLEGEKERNRELACDEVFFFYFEKCTCFLCGRARAFTAERYEPPNLSACYVRNHGFFVPEKLSARLNLCGESFVRTGTSLVLPYRLLSDGIVRVNDKSERGSEDSPGAHGEHQDVVPTFDWDDIATSGPVVLPGKQFCPHCQNITAFKKAVQLRSADEASTRVLRCAFQGCSNYDSDNEEEEPER